MVGIKKLLEGLPQVLDGLKPVLLYPLLGADALWYSFLLSSVASLALTLAVYFFAPWRKVMLARAAAAKAGSATAA